MKRDYDTAFHPPAPVVPIKVGRPDGAPAAPFTAMVDTGADVTVLPAGVPGELGLPTIGHVRVQTPTGAGLQAVYLGRVELAGQAVDVEVVGIGADALLGRNALAFFTLTLDGPRGELRLRLG